MCINTAAIILSSPLNHPVVRARFKPRSSVKDERWCLANRVLFSELNSNFTRGSRSVAPRAGISLETCQQLAPLFPRRFAPEQRKEIRLTIYRGEGCAFLIFQSSVVTAARLGRNDGRFASRFKLGSLDASEIPRGPRHGATSTDFQFERSRLRASVDCICVFDLTGVKIFLYLRFLFLYLFAEEWGILIFSKV